MHCLACIAPHSKPATQALANLLPERKDARLASLPSHDHVHKAAAESYVVEAETNELGLYNLFRSVSIADVWLYNSGQLQSAAVGPPSPRTSAPSTGSPARGRSSCCTSPTCRRRELRPPRW